VNQRETALKFEVTCAVSSGEKWTAIASANYHESHFGDLFDLRTSDGTRAHSACGAFGLERISLALVKRHGTDPTSWPASVKNQLWP
jgi:seryl-tRNA synthetase